jgi:small GTP-binding protein
MKINSDFEFQIKMVIIGDSGVGKTNFIFQFTEGRFSPHHVTTVGFDFKSRTIQLPKSKKKVKLQIWDTAGQERYMALNKNLFQKVQGIILMYDITNRESFERLNMWLNIIKELANDIPIILVGNKIDEENNEENGRIIEYSEGEGFGKKNGFQFIEASGLDGTNVDKVFYNISEIILKNLRSDSTCTRGNSLDSPVNNEKKKKCIC